MLLILFPSLTTGAVNGRKENSVVFVSSPPSSLQTHFIAGNPSFKVTSSTPLHPSHSEQVTRPAVTMVTNHHQQEDKKPGSQGRLNPTRLWLGRTNAVLPLSAASPQHKIYFMVSRPNAEYQQKGRSAWPRLGIAWLTACSSEQRTNHQLLWVSWRCTRTIWLLSHCWCFQPRRQNMQRASWHNVSVTASQITDFPKLFMFPSWYFPFNNNMNQEVNSLFFSE